MQIIDDIKEKITDFIHKNPRITVTIVAIIVFLALSAIVVGIVQGVSTPKTYKSVVIPVDESFKLNDELLPPQDKPLTEDYYFSRETKDRWTSQDFEQWFKEPDEDTIKDLKDANDNIIEKITGAAP